MELTDNSIKDKIKTLEEEFAKFSKDSQDELDRRNQDIQKSQQQLQTLVRALQTELDKRQGAIEALKALTVETPKVLPKPKTKK